MTTFHVLGKQQEEMVVSQELWLLPRVYTVLLPQPLLSLTLLFPTFVSSIYHILVTL